MLPAAVGLNRGSTFDLKKKPRIEYNKSGKRQLSMMTFTERSPEGSHPHPKQFRSLASASFSHAPPESLLGDGVETAVGLGLDDNGLGGRNPGGNEVRTCPARFRISNSDTFVKSQLFGTREQKPWNPICDIPHI